MLPAAGRTEEVTALLRAWRRGDPAAGDALLDRVYAHLKRLAAGQLRGERAGHSLLPTDLVHETYLRLIDQSRVDWRDRAHFFGLAATTMRRILVDRARRKHRKKRQVEEVRSGVAEVAASPPALGEVVLLDLDRALEKLAGEEARAARVVELRYFAGLEIEEVAVVLDVAPITVRRDWDYARAWIQVELGGEA